MDRRLLVLAAWWVLVLAGCSSKDSAAPQASAGAPAAPSPQAELANSMEAQWRAELALRAEAEAAERRQMSDGASAARSSSAGQSSGSGNQALEPRGSSSSIALQPPPPPIPQFPSFAPAPAPAPATSDSGKEPRIPTSPPRIQPGPAIPTTEIAPGSGVPAADNSANSPSGGSAPPVGGSAPPDAFNGPPIGGNSVGRAGGSSAAPAAPSSTPIAPSPAPAATFAGDESLFDVVEVLYGTDRHSSEQKASGWQQLLMQFFPTLVIGLVSAGFIVMAASRRNWLLGTFATIGLACCVLLGYDASDEVLERIRGTGKVGPRYTTDRSLKGSIELGRCEVTIPKIHDPGELETPSILRLEVNENATRHLILHKTERLQDSAFHELLRQRVEASARRELFVFVHGFNVSFEDAARRTAQIHYDLKFDGAPIFFSWPANDKFIFTYAADETNVAWSVPHLKLFLLDIVKESGAQSINLIAHSMGNRALAAALREIELEMRDQARLFNQVILAAPDIDADDFRNNIAPAVQRTARGLTLYASAHDDALLASQIIHRQPRAGDAGAGLIVVPGVDTIDVTAIDNSLWGHSYYGSSHPVLKDLRALISRATPAKDRTWLAAAERDGLTYWIFRPTRTASVEGGLNR